MERAKEDEIEEVSIHAFREGRRRQFCQKSNQKHLFQSTPSAREGDDVASLSTVARRGFNPRLPRGKATVVSLEFFSVSKSFNPRLPRGKATVAYVDIKSTYSFNPRLPRGKAT